MTSITSYQSVQNIDIDKLFGADPIKFSFQSTRIKHLSSSHISQAITRRDFQSEKTERWSLFVSKRQPSKSKLQTSFNPNYHQIEGPITKPLKNKPKPKGQSTRFNCKTQKTIESFSEKN